MERTLTPRRSALTTTQGCEDLRIAADLGPWVPLVPEDAVELLSELGVRWWVAGGWAIDLLIGRQTREHHDLDVLVLRPDHGVVRSFLGTWDLHAADPPGTLRPWPVGEMLPTAVHDIFCRRDPASPWSFQLMIDEVDGDDWLFRRDHALRRPLTSLAGRASRPGLPVLAPEIQLLYKSRGLRDRDLADFESVLPHLTGDERSWLRDALLAVSPDHEWITRL
jgi:hypothetical protein